MGSKFPCTQQLHHAQFPEIKPGSWPEYAVLLLPRSNQPSPFSRLPAPAIVIAELQAESHI
jgi:hypothetical protein